MESSSFVLSFEQSGIRLWEREKKRERERGPSEVSTCPWGVPRPTSFCLRNCPRPVKGEPSAHSPVHLPFKIKLKDLILELINLGRSPFLSLLLALCRVPWTREGKHGPRGKYTAEITQKNSKGPVGMKPKLISQDSSIFLRDLNISIEILEKVASSIDLIQQIWYSVTLVICLIRLKFASFPDGLVVVM